MSKHIEVNGKLVQANKRYSDLKQRQKSQISQWLYDAYKKQVAENITDDEALEHVFEKIDEAQIQRLLKPCLHRVAVGLYLPPVIPCPVVTESDKIPLHRIYYSESGCKNNKKIRLFKEKKVKMTQIRKNALPLQRRWRSPPL